MLSHPSFGLQIFTECPHSIGITVLAARATKVPSRCVQLSSDGTVTQSSVIQVSLQLASGQELAERLREFYKALPVHVIRKARTPEGPAGQAGSRAGPCADAREGPCLMAVESGH